MQVQGQSQPQEARLEQSRQFAIECARLLANTRCHNVVVLDVSGLSPVTDFFVLATGTSARQMKTVMQDVEELAENKKVGCMGRSGYEGEMWMLCDMIDVLVHVFSQDARMYYDLDSLWGDAKRVEWQGEPEGEKTEHPTSNIEHPTSK